MSGRSCEPSKLERRRVRAEAAAWIARLHGPDRTPAVEQGLRHWLAEHPLHAREFELATDVWNECTGTPGDTPKHPARRRRLILATATAAALLLAALLISGSDTHRIDTGVGEQKTVILADGSRVTLNTNSSILVHYVKSTRAITLEYGEAYFDVIHNSARPFIVRAGDRKVIDLGTRFIVSRGGARADSLTVTVIEGRVAVTPVAAVDPMISLPDVRVVIGGERLGYRPNTPEVVRSVSTDEATAWLNGQLIFDSTPLGEAAAQFNRYNSIKIKVPSPRAYSIPVGGVFRIGDFRSFARAVAQAHHLRLTDRDGEIILDPISPDDPPPGANSESSNQ